MGLYVITILIGSIAGILFYNDWKKMKRYNLYLEEQSRVDKRNMSTIMTLIQNLFLEEEFSLKKLSKLSREFFDEDDLVKYGWKSNSLFDNDRFFDEELDGPETMATSGRGAGINEEIDRLTRQMDESSINEWNEYGKEENKELMEARRDFFIKNFLFKIDEMNTDYRSQFLVSEKSTSTFIRRFSNLVK